MKFAVGYQLAEDGEEPFSEIVSDYREHIAEVYFPWADLPSGRAPLTAQRGYVDWTAQARLEEELLRFRELGVKLDLLLNSNCYGGKAASTYLENQTGSILEHLSERVGGVDVVTTASLAIARTVQKYFPQIDVRASVNMRIGTAQAMSYVSGLFDSYYVQRDVQRDVGHVRRLADWARENEETLCMLANSGCLRFCPGQTFHDNMVAHECDVDETVNIPDWTPHVCWNLYRNREKWSEILRATWIRPEDLCHYEGVVPIVKLATRMHSNPRLVIHAYAERRYHGNLLDLFEPGFGPAFAPHVVDNTRFPSDWFEHTSTCGGVCESCSYCPDVLDTVLVRFE